MDPDPDCDFKKKVGSDLREITGAAEFLAHNIHLLFDIKLYFHFGQYIKQEKFNFNPIVKQYLLNTKYGAQVELQAL